MNFTSENLETSCFLSFFQLIKIVDCLRKRSSNSPSRPDKQKASICSNPSPPSSAYLLKERSLPINTQDIINRLSQERCVRLSISLSHHIRVVYVNQNHEVIQRALCAFIIIIESSCKPCLRLSLSLRHRMSVVCVYHYC